MAAANSFHSKNISARHAIASAVQKVAQYLENLDPEELLDRCKQLEAIARSGNTVFNWSDPSSSRSNDFLRGDDLALTPEQLSALARQEEEQLRLQNAEIARARLIDPS